MGNKNRLKEYAVTHTRKRNMIFFIALSVLMITACGGKQDLVYRSSDMQREVEKTDRNETYLLEDWLGAYEQSGTLLDEIEGSVEIYIYEENGTYNGYLCVNGSKAGSSRYYKERILAELKAEGNMIHFYFLEKIKTLNGCYQEEESDLSETECKEPKLDRAIWEYEARELLFTLVKGEDTYSVIDDHMFLGKSEDGKVNDFSPCTRLSIDNICKKDEEIFLNMFRESQQFTEEEEPDYISYDNDGNMILELYLEPEQESGTGIYYGENQTSRYMTQFDIESFKSDVWQDNKYSLLRAGEVAAVTLDQYQEYSTYNAQGQLTGFYSEGMVTGGVKPQKEKLVQVDFCYREDGTLEKKICQYNALIYGTTRQNETYYFNPEEQLMYVTAYHTHGMLSDYYFYNEGEEDPAYSLTLDHIGQECYGELVMYANPPSSGAGEVSSESEKMEAVKQAEKPIPIFNESLYGRYKTGSTLFDYMGEPDGCIVIEVTKVDGAPVLKLTDYGGSGEILYEAVYDVSDGDDVYSIRENGLSFYDGAAYGSFNYYPETNEIKYSYGDMGYYCEKID